MKTSYLDPPVRTPPEHWLLRQPKQRNPSQRLIPAAFPRLAGNDQPLDTKGKERKFWLGLARLLQSFDKGQALERHIGPAKPR